MKAAVDAKALAAAVGRVAPFASRATTWMPVLACIKVEARDGALVLTATDIEHSATTTVEADVVTAGTALAPAAVLARSIGVHSGRVELVLDTGSLDLSGDSKSVTILTADPDTFPRIDWPATEPVPLGAAWADVQAVSKAASLDTARPGLCVVGFEAGDVYATDSHRLSWAPAPGTPDALVPATAVRRAAKILGTDVSMAATERLAVFTDGVTMIMSTLHVDGAVKWRGLVRTDAPHHLTFGAAAMHDAVAAVAALADDTNHVEGSFADGTLTLTRTVQDVGVAVASLPASGSWPEPRVGFDMNYMAEAVAAVGGDEVTVGAVDPSKPIVMTGERVSVLIMPVKLK